MKKNVFYIVGATVLVGGAYLFLKNKKKKDLLKLAEAEKLVEVEKLAQAEVRTGAGAGAGTTSNADLNLANATLLASERKTLVAKTKPKFILPPFSGGSVTTIAGVNIPAMANQSASIELAKKKLAELDKKLAILGYKVDAIGQLVKI